MPIKSLLIASDLSERSDRAIQRGFMLAAEMGARATVVSIVDDSLPEELIAELERRSRDLLHATASSLAGNVEFEIIVRRGDAISQLVEIVNSGGFDMAVVGIHRSRGVFDGLRPTTVESVVSQSLRPILLVAAPAHAAYGRVLAPVGFSPACQRAVEVSLCLAPKAAFRLFHAWMAPFEGLTGGASSDFARAVQRETAAQATAWSASLPASLAKVDLIHDSVAQGLSREMKSFAPDLLAVGANTRAVSFTGLGHFTADLVRDPPCDVLIARGSEA